MFYGGCVLNSFILFLKTSGLKCAKQVIPDSIAGLKELEVLDVSSNLLEYLPDSIGLLLSLKVLNVSGNKLNTLPESIAGCRYFIRICFLLWQVFFPATDLRR